MAKPKKKKTNPLKALLEDKNEFLELSIELLAQYKQQIRERDAEINRLNTIINELKNSKNESK